MEPETTDRASNTVESLGNQQARVRGKFNREHDYDGLIAALGEVKRG